MTAEGYHSPLLGCNCFLSLLLLLSYPAYYTHASPVIAYAQATYTSSRNAGVFDTSKGPRPMRPSASLESWLPNQWVRCRCTISSPLKQRLNLDHIAEAQIAVAAFAACLGDLANGRSGSFSTWNETRQHPPIFVLSQEPSIRLTASPRRFAQP